MQVAVDVGADRARRVQGADEVSLQVCRGVGGIHDDRRNGPIAGIQRPYSKRVWLYAVSFGVWSSL